MTLPKSKVTGALLGCAVGDAMGAPFEGLWGNTIPSGDELLENYHEYHGYPCGQYTDDTQLTVATVESVVERGGIDLHDIAAKIAGLWKHHDVIGPGGACTHAAEHFLATGDWTDMGAPDGQAGNGTAMRTTILGLMYRNQSKQLVNEVAEISRLTHQDSRSVAGGVAVAEACRLLAFDEGLSDQEFCDSISQAICGINIELADLIKALPERMTDENVTQFIAAAGQSHPEFEKPIITPFVIPTVLAALYCIMRFPQSWPQAVTAVIRLGGDVDTLGAIVGALAGARHGLDDIPAQLVDKVQNRDQLITLANRYWAFLNNNKATSSAT